MAMSPEDLDWVMQQIAADRVKALRAAGIDPLQGGLDNHPAVDQSMSLPTPPMMEPEQMNYAGQMANQPSMQASAPVPPAVPQPAPQSSPAKQPAQQQPAWAGFPDEGTGDTLRADYYGRAPAPRAAPSARPARPAAAQAKPRPTPESDAKLVSEQMADKWLGDLQAMYGQIRGTEFDVNRWVKKLSVGAKIMTGMSLAALAIADAMAERRGEQPRNSVQKVVSQLIDQDVAEQRENYERKLGDFKSATNLYGILRQKGLDEKAAEQAARAFKLQEMGLDQQAARDLEQARHNKAQEAHNNLMAKLSAMSSMAGGKTDQRAEEMMLNRKQRAFEKLGVNIKAAQSGMTALDDIERAFREYSAGKINAEQFQQVADSRRVPLARGLGEVGNLAQEEQQAILRGLPLVVNFRRPEGLNPYTWLRSDSEKSGLDKLNNLRELFKRLAKNAIELSPDPDARENALNALDDGLQKKWRPAGE